MPATATITQTIPKPPDNEPIACSMVDVHASLIGQPAAWLELQREPDSLVVRPRGPMPRRCTIRPAALFHQARGFPEVSTVMGRLLFPNGSTDSRTYKPFTRDPQRRLRELYLPVEAGPDDDWPASATRWSNYQAIAKGLLAAARVPWDGLSRQDIEQLVEFIPWEEPLEGCLLHALTQWTHRRDQCVIEIGSRRGRSLTMLAMALRGVGSDASLISVDPHVECPHNAEHVRLALRQIGEERRLVQFTCGSDSAGKLLRPGMASMIFIDGDHSYDQVLADFSNYRTLLAPGGCMAFHDYPFGDHNGLPDGHPGVRQVIDTKVICARDLRPLLLAQTLFALVSA